MGRLIQEQEQEQQQSSRILQQRSRRLCRRHIRSHENDYNNNNNQTTIISSSSTATVAAAIARTTTTTTTTESIINNNNNNNNIAVIINPNARGVKDWVINTVNDVFGNNDNDNVFVTTNAQEATLAAQTIMKNLLQKKSNNNSNYNYNTIISIGGDGTLTYTIQSLCDAYINNNNNMNNNNNNSRNYTKALQHIPNIAYIPMGTGNGVGSVIGCQLVPKKKSKRSSNKRKLFTKIFRSKQYKIEQFKELLYTIQNVTTTTTTTTSTQKQQQNVDNVYTKSNIISLPIMEVITNYDNNNNKKQELCFFAGVGFDSLMLNDFKLIKAWSKRTGILTNFLSSIGGYCTALLIRTLPQTIIYKKHNIHVHIEQQSSSNNNTKTKPTLWVDHRRGDYVIPIHDKILFNGTTGILAAGTAPYYGGKLRLFPFARINTDCMHIRLGRIHPVTGFFNIPSIFSGNYRDQSDDFGVIDFLGTDITVQVNNNDNNNNTSTTTTGYPFQHSGESIGHVQTFRLRVLNEPVKFINLLKQR